MLTSAETRRVAPGVAWLRVSNTKELFRGMKAEHGTTMTLAGRSLSRIDGRERVHTPGTLGLTQPGQVHCNVRRETPGSFQLVTFDAWRIEDARSALDQRGSGTLEVDTIDPRDPRADALRGLHRLMLSESADEFAREVVITEALTTLVSFLGSVQTSNSALCRSVRRARDFLLMHVAEPVTLDAVAEHARADKFHLCRAFSHELGFPPYAFLTQARIARARALLRRGLRPSEVAQLVGFCDQSQMHRHFVRIVGCTPAAYARQEDRA
ncbi:MAG TPA: AraC family transcriptional regulator [Polyangiales bacterium]